MSMQYYPLIYETEIEERAKNLYVSGIVKK